MPSVTIGDMEWTPSGPDGDRHASLHALLYVNGTPHHLTAIEVGTLEGVQDTANTFFEGDFNHYRDAAEVEGVFDTTDIMGRTYAIFMHPHT